MPSTLLLLLSAYPGLYLRTLHPWWPSGPQGRPLGFCWGESWKRNLSPFFFRTRGKVPRSHRPPLILSVSRLSRPFRPLLLLLFLEPLESGFLMRADADRTKLEEAAGSPQLGKLHWIS